MKSKKILIIAAFLMMVGLSTQALAAPAWYLCDVVSTGANSEGFSFVELKEVNGAWGPVYFYFPSNAANQLLALSITAKVNNNQVQAFVDPTEGFPIANTLILR